ncbi:hypothetical protein T01_3121 [Trichinella spiralis]|uniref:Uncharacterized protein n=1 Tax=Trichinella spiralis TaxID=6334 RepID=A0A0V1B884_TRISP|nr:hypothetical protein T01_3121 [Trichinella spiralis]
MNSGTKWEQHCAEVGPSPRPLFTVPCANKKYRNHAGRRVLLLFCPTSHVSAPCLACTYCSQTFSTPNMVLLSELLTSFSWITADTLVAWFVHMPVRMFIPPYLLSGMLEPCFFLICAEQLLQFVAQALDEQPFGFLLRAGDPQWYGGRWAVT